MKSPEPRKALHRARSVANHTFPLMKGEPKQSVVNVWFDKGVGQLAAFFGVHPL